MAAHLSHPLAVIGVAVNAAVAIALLVDGGLRLLRRQGLVQGAVGRRRNETFHDHQQRNRDYDNHQIVTLSRRRPFLLAIGFLGVVLLVLGIVF